MGSRSEVPLEMSKADQTKLPAEVSPTIVGHRLRWTACTGLHVHIPCVQMSTRMLIPAMAQKQVFGPSTTHPQAFLQMGCEALPSGWPFRQ